jgi:hypothetical protein
VALPVRLFDYNGRIMERRSPLLPLFVFVGLTAGGCSEYHFIPEGSEPKEAEDVVVFDTAEPEEIPPEPVEPPMAVVTPDGIAPGIHCGLYEEVVVVQNLGVGPLEVEDVRLIGDGWAKSHRALPVTLLTEETLRIRMSSTGGTGRLVILSNDPDVPAREVPLHVEQDAPPMVTIITPIGGDVLSPGAATRFEAVVTDDVDLPETLHLQWNSSVDGTLSTAPAAPDGVAAFDWNASEWATGDHLVDLTATDSCDHGAVDSVGFCQNEGYTEDSIDLESWNFEGSARWDVDNSWVELTAPITTQAGTAFQTTSTVSSDAVNIDFEFYVSGGSGADGISLTAIDAERMSSFVGGTGGGIGYYGLPGWSIEVDTWYNSEHNDPTTGDHVSVHIDGDVDTPLAWAALPEMEDGGWHMGSVEVVGSHMRVWVDGTLYIDESISGLSTFDAYVGFTAATGGSTNYHLIDALEVEGFICE